MIKVRAPTQWIGAAAIAVWPFVLVSDHGALSTMALRHEAVHLQQQRSWAIRGLGVGLLAWFFLYLLCLPMWRNPWREKWEREAFTVANGLSDERITEILRKRPYWLWGI